MKFFDDIINTAKITAFFLLMIVTIVTLLNSIFGRLFATCETKNLQAVELREVSIAEVIGSHTDYYIRFENGDVVKVDMPRTVAEYMDGKTYEVSYCEGYEPIVVELGRPIAKERK